MAARVVGCFGFKESDAEDAARSRRAMGRCAKWAGVVGKRFLGKLPSFSHPSGAREAGEIHLYAGGQNDGTRQLHDHLVNLRLMWLRRAEIPHMGGVGGLERACKETLY